MNVRLDGQTAKKIGKALAESLVVLIRQDRRRRQDRHLKTPLDDLEGGPHCHLRLSKANVTAQQTIHWAVTFQVQPFSPETMPRPIDAKVLGTIAAASGGTFFESLKDLNDGLAQLEFNAIEEETAEFETLWRDWVVISLLMTGFSIAWALRKLRNLP